MWASCTEKVAFYACVAIASASIANILHRIIKG